MATSLYQQSIPIFVKYLHALSGLLNKAVDHAAAKNVPHEKLLTFRLIEDMRP